MSHLNKLELFGKNCENCPAIPCYADDVTVVTSSKSRETNQVNLKNNLNTISNFLIANKLAVNKEKTTITEIMTRQKRTKIHGTTPSLIVPDKDGNPKLLVSQQHTRLLGINLNRELNWNDHLESGEKSLLPILKKQLPKSSKLMLVNGLVMSKICYLLQIWGSASNKLLSKVQVIMNKAARFVTGWGKRTNTNKLMTACKWLPIRELIIQKSITSLWSIIHKKIPIKIADQLTTDTDLIITTKAPRLMITANSFKLRTIGKWNQLETTIRQEQSLPRFKKALKLWITQLRPPETDQSSQNTTD